MKDDAEADQFDFADWLESVDGQTVEVTSLGRGLGPRLRGFTPRDESLCGACEEFVQRVSSDPDDLMGHCPICGRTPGALELGTESVEEWRETPEEQKNV